MKRFKIDYIRILVIAGLILFLVAIEFAPRILRRLYIYPGVTNENFAKLVVPADENEGIFYDIDSFLGKDNVIYLFVPTRADISKMVYYAVDSKGNYLERYVNDFTQFPSAVLDYPVVCMNSNLPTMEINIYDEHGSMEDVLNDEKHETKAFGEVTLSVRDDEAIKYGWDPIFKSNDNRTMNKFYGSASVKGRGNLSWLDEKKSLLLELESDVSLLGMAHGEKWVLLANSVDHTLLRNEIMLNLAKDCNAKYVPDIQAVDLFVDGEYYGNYSLCSKVEISESRVNIDEDDYFYRWGLPTGNYREVESTSLWNDDNLVELIYPKKSDKENEAFDIAQRMIAEIEDTKSSDYLNNIDLDSFIRYYWVQEISKNTDAANRSLYSCWDNSEQKMKLIAPWDFDRTVGTVEPWNKDLDYDYPTSYTVREDEWYKPFFEHKEVSEAAQRIYQEEISEALGKAVSEIPGRIERSRQSATMNFIRWDVLNKPYEDYYNVIEKYMGDRSYESEITWLYEWMRQRKEWLDSENGVTQ